MAELKRWKTLNKLFLVNIGLILFFAWMDAKQIISFHMLNTEEGWTLYQSFTGPAILTSWVVFILITGLIWWFATKDKSESIALAGSSLILLASGLEDFFFFIFSATPMPDKLCWLGFPQNIVSKLLGECCVTPWSLILNILIGSFIAYKVFEGLKRI